MDTRARVVVEKEGVIGADARADALSCDSRIRISDSHHLHPPSVKLEYCSDVHRSGMLFRILDARR